MRTKAEQKALWTESKADYLRKAFTSVGDRYKVTPLEEDHNAGLPGTESYPGRALAFIVSENNRSYRVLVEDITLDEEDPEWSEDEDREPSDNSFYNR